MALRGRNLGSLIAKYESNGNGELMSIGDVGGVKDVNASESSGDGATSAYSG